MLLVNFILKVTRQNTDYHHICTLAWTLSKAPVLIEINMVAKDFLWTQKLVYDQVSFCCSARYETLNIVTPYIKRAKSGQSRKA